MSIIIKVTLYLVVVTGYLLLLPSGAMASSDCFCGTDLSKITDYSIAPEKVAELTASCVPASTEADCLNKAKGGKDLVCVMMLSEEKCIMKKLKWGEEKDSKIKPAVGQDFTKAKSSKFIPECFLIDPSDPKNKAADDTCRDISIFVYFLINVARYLFGIVGALALVMFVYGGFTLILSQGNSEKVKKGSEIIFASVIGLVIMFGAYMLIQFLGEAVSLKNDFMLK